MPDYITQQSIIFHLLAAALFSAPVIVDANTDWRDIHREMRAQTVQGLVMDLLTGLLIPEDLKKIWSNECLQVLTNGLRLRTEQEDFLRILEGAKIPYVILKGTAAAMYYPNPLLRGMGDVDIFVPDYYHKELRDILLLNGYAEKDNNESYKRHIAFFKNNTEFEVHRSFATINGQKEKAYLDRLLEECCLDRSKTVRIEQGATAFYAPETYVNGLVLLEHIGQHMMTGLGLRQIIDWMMFVNTALHDEEWGVFQKMTQAAGLETLAKATTKMCISFLGLKGEFSWCMDAEDDLVEMMMAYIMNSGNFGRKMEDVNIVIRVRNRFKMSGNVFKTLQERGEHNWEMYKRFPMLRPLAGVYQSFRYVCQVLRNRDGIKTLRKGTVEVNRRARLMDGLRIYRE